MDHFLDAMGEMCPLPIIKAEIKIKQIKVKERVVLKTDHSCSISSVTNHFLSKYGYPCSVVELEDGVWEITIEKTA